MQAPPAAWQLAESHITVAGGGSKAGASAPFPSSLTQDEFPKVSPITIQLRLHVPELGAVLRCHLMQSGASGNRRARAMLGTLVLLAASVPGCADCDRQGCEALRRLAPEGDTGVAGVVAQVSDVVSDGCAECPLGRAALELWTLEEPFYRRSEVPELVAARPPDLTLLVEGSYRQALSTGWYLLCVRPNCIELNPHEDEMLTVNIKRRDGPTSFFVGRPSSSSTEEDFGFEVGY